MKQRIIIYIVILLIGIGIFLHVTVGFKKIMAPAIQLIRQQKWLPGYCDQFSGFYSYAWGGPLVKQCENAGCHVKKIQEITTKRGLQYCIDCDGYTFQCVR